jgi:cytochrome c-type biogenesis protein
MDAFLTSFTLGLLATTSPCVFPLYPGFLAYLSGGQEKLANSRGRYFLGFFVLAGVLVMMLLLGALIILNINPFKQLPQVKVPVLSHPFLNAFIYGLFYGPITLPCSGPLVVSIFALSFSVEEAAGRLLIFLWFGLGFGVPLLALSFLAGAAQRWITRLMARHSRWINLGGGLLLVAVGIWDIIKNWDIFTLMLGL